MAVNTVGDVLRMRFFTYLTNQVGINTIHYRIISIAGAGPFISSWSAWNAREAVVGPLYPPCISAAAQYLGSGATWIAPSVTPSTEIGNTSQAGNGTMSATPLPGQVAGIITKTSATPGPAGRGRVYVPFPGVDAITTPVDHPNAAYVALISSLANGLFPTNWSVTIAGLTLNFVPVILRKAPLGAAVVVTGATARSRWGTQRRRGDYGRQNPLPF